MATDVLPRQRRSPFLPGLGGLLRGEIGRWLGRRGLVHIVTWTVIIQGMLYIDAVHNSRFLPDWRGFDALIHLWWIATPLAAIAIAQNALTEERRNDTLPWVLSKPVSRSAFVVSKTLGDTIGLVVSAVLLQGTLAYAWMPRFDPERGLPIAAPELGRFLVVMAFFALVILFFVSFTVFLTTFLPWRGPAAAAGLVLWVLLWIAPWRMLTEYTIGGLVSGELPTGTQVRTMKSIAAYLVVEQPLEPISAIVWTAVASVAFIILGSLILRREQL